MARPLPAPTGALPWARRSLGSGARWGRDRVVRGARLAWAPEHRKLTLPLVVLSIVSTLATAASPWLLGTPFLLALLTPRMPFLALAAPVTPLPIFLALGTVRLCVADPFHYLLGRRVGEAGAHLVHVPPRVRSWVVRFGTPAAFVGILLRPVGRHLFFAGTAQSHPIAVGVADVASTVLFLVAVHAGASLF